MVVYFEMVEYVAFSLKNINPFRRMQTNMEQTFELRWENRNIR